MNGGQPISLWGPQLPRPGAFRVEGAAPPAGAIAGRWNAAHLRPPRSRRSKSADEPAALAEVKKLPPDDAAAIAYLKEQQWTNESPLRRGRRQTFARRCAFPRCSIRCRAARPSSRRRRPAVSWLRLPHWRPVRAGGVLARLEPRLSAGEDRATLIAAPRGDASRRRSQPCRTGASGGASPARRARPACRRRKAGHSAGGVAVEGAVVAGARDATLRTGGGVAAGNAFSFAHRSRP